MATYYLDYEGGNDANAGTSFALRWKTLTSGATAARIAPGDTVRVMGSPDPTSLGVNGTWTDCKNGGSNTSNITSSTNATPIVVTTATHGLSTNDYVWIDGHTTNTNANGFWKITVLSTTTFSLTGSTGNGVGGATGSYKKYNNNVVELASAVTKTIASTGNRGEGRTAWTASANVTTTIGTTTLLKSSDCNDSIAVAAAFTTGKAAYKALGSAMDFSAYNQISFTIAITSGTVPAASDLSIKLCSDTAGATAVNTFNIPAFGSTSTNHVFTIDNGSALGSSIQSVALYVNTDSGAQTFLIDNIIACTSPSSADSLSKTSLIGKNSGTETWYAIAAIRDTLVLLDNSQATGAISNRGYSGTTETVTTYKREPIVLPALATTTTNSALGAIQDSGTSGSLIAFEGGWDRTAMTTQNAESWYQCINGSGIGLTTNAKSFFSLNKINFSRFETALLITGSSDTSIDNFSANNCATGISFAVSGNRNYFGTINSLNNNSTAPMLFGITSPAITSTAITAINACHNNIGACSFSAQNGYLGSINIYNSTAQGFYLNFASFCVIGSLVSKNGVGITYSTANNNTFYNATISNSPGYAITVNGANVSAENRIYNLTTSGSVTGAISIGVGSLYLRNASLAETTEYTVINGAGNNPIIYSEKHDGTTDNNYIYKQNGVVLSNTTTRHTASGISWKMSPTSLNASSYSPLKLSIAKIACTANNLVTVKAWMQRDSTSLTMSLFCPGGQLAGVASDVTSSMTAAINTWEELTITFTPTEAGVIEIFALAYGGTTLNGYVDDMTITQA